MRECVLAMVASMLCMCGCRNPDMGSPEAKEGASMPVAASEKQTSSVFELRVERAKAEALGFTFARMASYFSGLRMSKHEYSTEYRSETFAIGMRETAAQLRRIMELRLRTDQGNAVRLGDLCTVHHGGM